MSDQVIAALITGVAGIIAALIGLRWREWSKASGRPVASGTEPPIFDAARQFAKFTTLEQKKKTIQPIEVALSHGTVALTINQMEACASSEWELDRIGLYLFEEYTAQPNHIARLMHVRHEYERVRAATYPRSSLPLVYALHSLLVLARQQPLLAEAVGEGAELLVDIMRFCGKHPHLDPDHEIRRLVDKLLGLLERRRLRSA